MDRLPEEDRRVIRQANLLLEQLNAGSTIGCVEDITAPIFVTLFEGLCGEKLTGIIRSPVTKEDEIRNVQIVIDALASDVLHTSLAHISGREVVEGNRESLLNLLEIFSGLLEYILNKIDSDVSTDNDDDQEEEEDPDALHPDVIDRILERELQKRDQREISPDRTPKANRTHSLLRRRESPLRKSHDDTNRLLGISNESSTGIRETTASTDQGDSTNELIKSAEDVDLEHKLRVNSLNGRHPVKTSQEIRAEIARHRRDLGLGRDPFDDLVEVRSPGKIGPTDLPPSGKERIQPPELPPGGKERIQRSDSYHSLQQMIEETAAMAKEAVDCSPTRAQHILQNMDNIYNRERFRDDFMSPTKSAREPVQTSPSRKTKSPARKSDEDLELTPSRAKRKVSFLVERSTTSESSPSLLKKSPRSRPCVRTAWDESPPPKPSQARPRQDNTKSYPGRRKAGQSRSLDFSSDRENLSYDDYLKKQFHEIVDEVLSEEEFMPGKHRSRNDQRRVRSERFKGKKGTYTVTDTQRLLAKERDSNRQKIEFLQKIYQEDLDELANEAEYEIDKDRKTAKDTEEDFKKKVLTKPKKTVPKEPGAVKKKALVQKPKATVSSKAKKSTGKGLTPAATPKLTIKDDEDILPMLIKEFPHLHLSLHTWHELWRKGIHQIEQITRANQEVRRKKSKAKAELEEAEKRHGIMVNIMKKELEHGERMKEIKQRQKNAVVTRNLIKEQRSQSARSRQYYDEYQVRMRSKMLKRRTREETIFKKLFKDGLEIQKDRVKELRKYAKEQRDRQAKVQRNEIESMENYYRDQFDMLAESVTKEREELHVREKAQQKVLGQMKKELRKKMETEIKSLQDQLCRDDDDAYFRQLDADRVIHDLQMAKYHVHNI